MVSKKTQGIIVLVLLSIVMSAGLNTLHYFIAKKIGISFNFLTEGVWMIVSVGIGVAFAFGYLIIINGIGMSIMLIDKRRARLQKYRISEAMIWTVSIIGGAVGTTVGMFVFRHKTKHFLFKLGLPFVSLVHIVGVVYIIRLFM